MDAWCGARLRRVVRDCLVSTLLVGCATEQTATKHARPTTSANQRGRSAAAPTNTQGLLRFECEPTDAEVYLDGQSRGTVAQLRAGGGLQVAMGLQRIELRRRGYVPFRVELVIGRTPETIRVHLRRKSGDGR